MIQGQVSANGVPTIQVWAAGQEWTAAIDTGFNGDLELPEALRTSVNADYLGPFTFALAGGQTILEDVYIVDFPFDGKVIRAWATFVPDNQILIGTRLLRDYQLRINFVTQTVELEQAVSTASYAQ